MGERRGRVKVEGGKKKGNRAEGNKDKKSQKKKRLIGGGEDKS